MTNFIGLTGHKGSGKSTAALLLSMNHRFSRRSFADPIKRMLETLISRRYLDSNKEEMIPEVGCNARHMMQTLGTEWGRNMINQSLWINLLFQRIEKEILEISKFGPPCFVIEDVRFPDEAAAIRDRGGEIWKITRDGMAGDGHVSETSVDVIEADHILHNNGSLLELEREVASMLRASFGAGVHIPEHPIIQTRLQKGER